MRAHIDFGMGVSFGVDYDAFRYGGHAALSADRRSLITSFSSPSLIGRDLVCANASTTALSIDSAPYDSVETFYFRGLEPRPDSRPAERPAETEPTRPDSRRGERPAETKPASHSRSCRVARRSLRVRRGRVARTKRAYRGANTMRKRQHLRKQLRYQKRALVRAKDRAASRCG